MGLFGNSAKSRPDFTPEMMPKNRFQLFFEMLRLNFFTLFKLNVLYFLFWIPFWTWTWMNMTLLLNNYESIADFANDGYLMVYVAGAALCATITGPAKCAVKYITRNIARDEHIWLWQDFWHAFKANWKQGLALSALNGLLLFLFTYGVSFYDAMANSTGSAMYMFLQVLLLVLAAIYLLLNLYAWPMMVTYDLKMGQIFRNSLVLALARLPQSLLFGLITLLPLMLALIWPISLVWYFVIGYSMHAFINVSYTNGAFDKFFNSRIEGAEVGKGMLKPEDDDDYEDDYDDEYEDLDPDEEDKK